MSAQRLTIRAKDYNKIISSCLIILPWHLRMLCLNIRAKVQKEPFKNKSAYYTTFLLMQHCMISAVEAFLNDSFHLCCKPCFLHNRNIGDNVYFVTQFMLPKNLFLNQM